MLSGGYWHIKEGVLGDGQRIKRSGTLALLCALVVKLSSLSASLRRRSADEPLGYVSVTLRLR